MGVQTNGGSGFESEINVTPLVDVVLVLLIIFMVVIPLSLRGYDVDIPGQSVASAEVRPADRQVVLQIDAEACPILEPPESAGLPGGCRVRIDGESVAATDLPERVRAIFGQRNPEERVLFLSAQDRLNYEGVMRVIGLAKSGTEGLRIGLITDETLIAALP